ncbi:hypothetical protein [Cytobacillus horneckiae]|uniref:hypothetical protein n=1 Tax=Cytobacillus horneckiae TaxID=549687 RepID=UPI003D9A0B87
MAETIDMTDVKMIQDRIIKDNKNLFTPFITTDEEYSMQLTLELADWKLGYCP